MNKWDFIGTVCLFAGLGISFYPLNYVDNDVLQVVKFSFFALGGYFLWYKGVLISFSDVHK